MNKLKVMLLSFVLVAVVGGALAFKAKYDISYCTAPTDPGAVSCPSTKACPNLTIHSYICSTGTFVCTANPVVGRCSGVECGTTSAQICDEGVTN